MKDKKTTSRRAKILAISSAGGHWVQLQRMRPAWDDCQVTYVTSKPEYETDILPDARDRGQPEPQFYTIVAANRWQKFRLVWQLLKIVAILIKVRPDVIISTGAASGYFAIRVGKMMGARAIWVDSVANAETLSLSGVKIGPYADLWLTQWEHLATENTDTKHPEYKGAVI